MSEQPEKGGFGATPPLVTRPDSAVPSALAVDQNGLSYIFYYNKNECVLHCATGFDGKNFSSTPVAIDSVPIKPPPGLGYTAPLAAGFDATSKQVHLFYVKETTKLVGEIYTGDGGDTFATGKLDKYQGKLVNPLGSLTAFSDGKVWRVVMRQAGNPDTFVQLYQKTAGDDYTAWIIP